MKNLWRFSCCVFFLTASRPNWTPWCCLRVLGHGLSLGSINCRWLSKFWVGTTRFFWGEKNPHQYLGRRTLLKLDKKLTIEAWGGQQKFRAHDDLKFEMPLVCLRRRPWKWGLPARSRHDRPRWTNLSSLEVAEIAMEMNTWLIGCLNMLNRMFRLRGNTNTCCFL